MQCFTKTPNSLHLNNHKRNRIGITFEIPTLLVYLVHFSLIHRSEPGFSETMSSPRQKPSSTSHTTTALSTDSFQGIQSFYIF